jgi:hypothetical protein
MHASDLLLLHLPNTVHIPRVGSFASHWTRNRATAEGVRWDWSLDFSLCTMSR